MPCDAQAHFPFDLAVDERNQVLLNFSTSECNRRVVHRSGRLSEVNRYGDYDHAQKHTNPLPKIYTWRTHKSRFLKQPGWADVPLLWIVL